MIQQQFQVAATVMEEQKLEGGGGPSVGNAPPKQVALAMERLGQAARLIADIRLGADRFLETLIAMENPRQSGKSSKLIVKAESSMRQHLQDLRVLGKQLEESGVLNEYLKSRGDSWCSHMPLVCPDGAVVAYAWKRQLAGQAGASAVDRTRLALKAFTDQKKRFFPHLEDQFAGQSRGALSVSLLKKQCVSRALVASHDSSLGQCESLSDLLSSFEKETPNMQIFTYQRLDWFKRASSLANLNAVDTPKEQTSHSKPQLGSLGSSSVDQVAILELVVPFVFRAVVALHPAGSINPDSVSFFSPDEGGNHIHSRGKSIYNAYKHIKDHADKALQFFNSVKSDASLSLLMNWICSYRTLFSKSCSKCGRVMIIDKSLKMLLPPVCRSYNQIPPLEHSFQTTPSTKEHSFEYNAAFHIDCYSDETQR